MLGRHSPQGELFRPDNLHIDYVGRDSFYGFLAEERHRLFRDEDFAGLYRIELGRPSVPPSQLCLALLLQAKDGASDEEAISRTAFDLRWKVALGIDLEEKLCAKSTLQLFRAKLVVHEKYGAIFQASIEACRRRGLLRCKKLEVALDTTPILGRGAVKDTFNLISDQIRHVIDALVDLQDLDRDALVAQHGLGRHFGSSLKGQVEIDWDDAEQKNAVLGQLVADARVALALATSALAECKGEPAQTAPLRAARDLLAEILLQDVEEGEGGDPSIRKGTKPDRIVSTTDPDMRHGRKAGSKKFNGFKASVAVETEGGVIVATDVIPGNAHDSQGAGELTAQAADNTQLPVGTVLGDTAYGSVATREEIKAAGADEVVAKAPPVPTRKGLELTADHFVIDLEQGVATCPAGNESKRYTPPGSSPTHTFLFSRRDCTGCPLRPSCTTSKDGARKLNLSENYEELKRLREFQRTDEFKQAYRKRVKVEHRIARLVQLGARQARYFGRGKVAFQLMILAAVANLVLALAAAPKALSWALARLRRVHSALRGHRDQFLARFAAIGGMTSSFRLAGPACLPLG